MSDKDEKTAIRGLDGLSTEELRATRQGFWDDAFTEVLLRRIPESITTIVDIGCGLANAAHALLPRLSAVNYVGVDADEQRLQDAEKLLAGVPYVSRVNLRVGCAERLPLPDAQTEFVLTCLTLQHLLDAAEAAREIVRILAPRGRVIAVEPDNLHNLFYFDANLEDVNMVFQDLFARLRRERFPADSAIGPAVARLFERREAIGR